MENITQKRNEGEYKIVNYVEDSNDATKAKTQASIAAEALIIANEAQFPTDYQDVYEHLFGDPNFIRLFIINKETNRLKGFLIACELDGLYDTKLLHFHGIILHPSVQGKGMSQLLLKEAISMTLPDIISAKTHNPRAFNLLASLAYLGTEFYPNIYGPTPKEILEIARSNPFISGVNDNLVVENAYPDAKLQQSYRKEQIKTIFDNLGDRDAQAILVGLRPLLFEENNNVKKLVRR